MKTLNQLNSEIFKIVKTKQSFDYQKLNDLIKDSSKEDIKSSIDSLILEYKLITKGSHILKLTEKGLKYDLFESYLESLEKQKQKEDFDFQISKFLYKYKFLPHLLSFIGIVVSVISIIIAVKSKKANTTEKQLLKPESTIIADSVSISNQTKKVDSLRNSKNLTDLKTEKDSISE